MRVFTIYYSSAFRPKAETMFPLPLFLQYIQIPFSSPIYHYYHKNEIFIDFVFFLTLKMHRPISLLPTISKILEELILNRINKS